MKKILNIVYYAALVILVSFAALMIISLIPIPGNYDLLTVQSGSMKPAIKTGSVAVVKPADEYKIGDVITFDSRIGDQTITHRVYDVRVVGGEKLYTTKGDVNNAPDPREVSESDVVGKVLISIPLLGYAVDFMQKPLGFALLIVVPAFLIIFDEIKKIYAEAKKPKKNNE